MTASEMPFSLDVKDNILTPQMCLLNVFFPNLTSMCQIKSVFYHLGAISPFGNMSAFVFFRPPFLSHPIHQPRLKRSSVSWWERTACTIQLPYTRRDMKRQNINADSMRSDDESHTSILRSFLFLIIRTWKLTSLYHICVYWSIYSYTRMEMYSVAGPGVRGNNYPLAIICLPLWFFCIPAGKTNNRTNEL